MISYMLALFLVCLEQFYRANVAVQVGLPSSDSESECKSETGGYGSEPEEKYHHGEGDDLVPVDICSGSESARDVEDGDENDNAVASLSVSAPGKDELEWK